MSVIDVMLEEIRTEARSLDPGKVAATVVAAPFVALGWLLVQASRLVFGVGAFVWSAGVVGWRHAGGAPSGARHEFVSGLVSLAVVVFVAVRVFA